MLCRCCRWRGRKGWCKGSCHVLGGGPDPDLVRRQRGRGLLLRRVSRHNHPRMPLPYAPPALAGRRPAARSGQGRHPPPCPRSSACWPHPCPPWRGRSPCPRQLPQARRAGSAASAARAPPACSVQHAGSSRCSPPTPPRCHALMAVADSGKRRLVVASQWQSQSNKNKPSANECSWGPRRR